MLQNIIFIFMCASYVIIKYYFITCFVLRSLHKLVVLEVSSCFVIIIIINMYVIYKRYSLQYRLA